MHIKALDISKWQVDFDPTVAKVAGIGLVICRVAYGTAPDTKWHQFTASVNAAGMPLAAYGFLTAHYTCVNGGSLALARTHMHKQIDVWVQLAKSANVRWLAVDEEAENAATGKTLGLSKADNTTLLREACQRIEAAGIQPVVYTGAAWAMANIDLGRFAYPLWIAYYYKDPGDPDFLDGALPSGRYGNFLRSLGDQLLGWQFGRIKYGPKYGAGSDNIDRNYFYETKGDKPMTDYTKYSDTVLLGPASSGDQRIMLAAINALGGIDCGTTVRNADTYVYAGPMTGGDKYTVLRRADELALPIQNYTEPTEPVAPVTPAEPQASRLVITGLNEAQAMVIKGVTLLFGGNVEEE